MIVAALELQTVTIKVHPRTFYRLAYAKPVLYDIEDDLHHGSPQTEGAGTAGHEMRAPVPQDDGGTHPGRQATAGARRLRKEELPDHVVQVDSRSGHDDSRTRAGRRGERNRVPAPVDDRDVRRAARHYRPFLEQLRQALPRPAACVGLRTHNARQRVDRLGASRSADVLEQSEPVRDQRSARARRRIRQELVATKLRTHGPASNDAVLREITLGHASP